MSDLTDLTAHLTAHFREFGGQFAAPYAETFANLAISGIGTFYPGGWTITADNEPDGIRDGISRAALVKLLTKAVNETTHTETRFRFRGVDLAATTTFDGLNVETDSWQDTLSLWSVDDLMGALTAVNIVDQWVDIIREQADRPAKEVDA